MNASDPSPAGNGTIPPPSAAIGWRGWWNGLAAQQRRSLSWFLGCLTILTLAFARSLASLMIHAWGTELHSHILLVPIVSTYLLRLRFGRLPTDYPMSPGWALAPFLAGAGALVAAWMLQGATPPPSLNNHLALMSLAYVCWGTALGFFFLGRRWMAAAAFPVSFLFFMVPLPDSLVASMEAASQRGSTETADWFFHLAGIPVLRDGNVFQLPGIVLQVATECSGIRSSLVLFITSLVASHMFLRTTWRRLVLVALIIPLGLLRNGFRIMVIGWLCVEMGPHMINSIIHHRGGPLFFVLSLIPLFLLLWWLRRGEASGKCRMDGGLKTLPHPPAR